MRDEWIVIRGGGDLGSGVALRLWRAGFPVAILESAQPTAVRRTVSFSEAVYDGQASVEEAQGRLTTPGNLAAVAAAGEIPVVVDPQQRTVRDVAPFALVDAILAKRNTGTRRGSAPLVVGLGPGFIAGVDVDAVVETNRGPHLGRVIWDGPAEPNTGHPGAVGGETLGRVLRAPRDGIFAAQRVIGDIVEEGDVVADVGGVPLSAKFRGVLRGLIRDGFPVTAGMKVGDVDPRCDPTLCRLVSDKSLAVAGGVTEAVLKAMTEQMQ